MRNQIIYDYFYDTAYKLNAPVSVMIELLTKCNLRCEHCYLPSHDEEGLSFDTVKRILYELKDMGVVNVSFTGGEILIRKDLIDIVSIARELKMRVFLLSNGTLLNNEIAKQLAKLYISEFSTTIFSLDKNIHDSITGKEGSLVKLLNGLKLLEESSIRVRLKTPLMKKNMHCFKEIAEFCEKKGYEYLTSPLIFSKNNGDTSPKNLRIKESELCFIMRDLDILNRNDHLHKKDVPCAALLYSFAIDSKGDVHPCNSFLYKVGNIYNSSLKEIWYNSTELTKIRNIKYNDLKNCNKCKFVSECDRCPGMVYMENNDFYSCDTFARQIAKIRMSPYY